MTLHPLAEPELKALPEDMRARFRHISELLEGFGPQHVGLPHIRPLEGKLWEMRMQGRDGIRRVCRRSRPQPAGAACVYQEDPNHAP